MAGFSPEWWPASRRNPWPASIGIRTKDNWFEINVTVDPQYANVEALFRFPLNGKIYPSKTLRSRYAAVERTIEILNLNAPSLIKRRERLLATAAADTQRMTQVDWQRHYLEAGQDGSLQEFLPALRYNFELHWRGHWPN